MQLKLNLAWIAKITAAICGSIILSACTPVDNITSSLQTIETVLSAGNAHNTTKYNLSNDVDFPCKITLQENWQDTEANWHQSYRFDLTDIEKSTFVQSKAGRRAIIYSGYKQVIDGQKKVFNEIRINNIRYRAELSNNDQHKIITEMNKAITLCEEEYNF